MRQLCERYGAHYTSVMRALWSSLYNSYVSVMEPLYISYVSVMELTIYQLCEHYGVHYTIVM